MAVMKPQKMQEQSTQVEVENTTPIVKIHVSMPINSYIIFNTRSNKKNETHPKTITIVP